jgi:hypothetical protein
LSRRLNAGFELFRHGHGCLALGRRGEGRGTERNVFLCLEPGTPRHWLRRSQDPKGPISLALGSWRWGGEYGGGRDVDWE